MNNTIITVIMPTLNSERTIDKALGSIRMQNIDQNLIEILVIDGGSTDSTREIANKYEAKILENPSVVPEAAKHIGIMNAKGKYVVFMDSDEELTRKDQMQKRLELFAFNPEVKNIIPASISVPADYPSLSRYINSFGDPFSYFVYKVDSEEFPKSFKEKCRYTDDKAGIVFYFNAGDILAIADGGTCMFDLGYCRETFPEEVNSPNFVTTYFVKMVSLTQCMGIVEDDIINHYASTKLSIYFKKLKFRVINNLNNNEESFAGFASKATVNKSLNARKYLFPVYCLLFLWPLWDSLKMAANKKSPIFLMHFVFVYYVLFQVVCQYTMRISGKQIRNKTYGK
ncbi:glycosyltransferase [Paenibacillus humicus]|uniref:glycosyltransferase n=1 Tax=Paenibacillus humicus TaxID=412861 RepID=UPI003F137729